MAEYIYSISIISNNDIQRLNIVGSPWIREGIVAGQLVGGLACAAIGSTFEESKEKGLELNGLKIVMGTVSTIADGITVYAISTEEYIIVEIPPNYNWSFLKLQSRYPVKEPDYLKAIE